MNQEIQSAVDVVIIGGGPAGLTAGIYASRAGLSNIILEKMLPGGQAANTDRIDNYPGFPEGIPGVELGIRMDQQARQFGSKIINASVRGLEGASPEKVVDTSAGDFVGRAVIIASGVRPAQLGVPGEKELAGKGVSYCATCDGPLFREKRVMVAGGGNAAVGEAIYLANLASQVMLVHRRDQLRAMQRLQDRALAQPKIQFVWNTVVTEIMGEQQVERVALRNVKTDETSELETDAVFIYVGVRPNTQFLGDEIEKDEKGFIITDQELQTSLPGVFAAGDVRSNAYRQVVAAAAEGALAARSAHHYLTGA